jgi:fructose-1,6-bisphosphatase I
MPHRSMTFAKFIIEDQRRRGGPDTELTALLNDVQTACKLIAVLVSRGLLQQQHQTATGTNVHGAVRSGAWHRKNCPRFM